MKWEEIIAEARAAGHLKFCADGIAVLQQKPTHAPPPQEIRQSGSDPSERLPGEDRGQGRQGGDGEGESAE